MRTTAERNLLKANKHVEQARARVKKAEASLLKRRRDLESAEFAQARAYSRFETWSLGADLPPQNVN